MKLAVGQVERGAVVEFALRSAVTGNTIEVGAQHRVHGLLRGAAETTGGTSYEVFIDFD